MHTIIVGAGIAGLWLADQLAARGDQVTLLEKADYLGGRILTSSIGLEIGAGRIATNHRRVLALVKRFGLNTHPIPAGEQWKGLSDIQSQPNTFYELWSPIIKLLSQLDPIVLATHTLRELAEQVAGPTLTATILERFGFRAETETLRADLAIEIFKGDMSETAQFVGVKGGLSQLTAGLADACKSAGVTIRLNTQVIDVDLDGIVHTDTESLTCDRVILALPVEALKRIPRVRTFKPLRHLKMEPLTRIYAKFATSWTLSKKLITDSPLRFIIPILPDLGLVMISYTESQDTQSFKGLTGLTLAAALYSELQRLFPNETVPPILWAHAYEWSHGCTYWLPGNYDPVAESKAALQPFPKEAPRLHLCNESFSLRQAWMEGSLEHAAALLAHITRETSSEDHSV